MRLADAFINEHEFAKTVVKMSKLGILEPPDPLAV
jgi:hypothetical protein